MLEDVLEVVAELQGVEPVLVLPAAADPPGPAGEAWRRAAVELVWPGVPVVDVPAVDVPAVDRGPLPSVPAVSAALAGLGGSEAVLVAPDAPDLPGLLLAKLFRGLAGRAVAACPAEGGGLVALGVRLPAVDWLVASGVTLDAPDALDRLVNAAGRRSAVSVGPGWRRLRAPADLGRLDAGLEGWAATRALLAALPPAPRGAAEEAPPAISSADRPAARLPRAR